MGKMKKVQIFYSNTNRGPGKVVNNLKLGLEKIGFEFISNGEFDRESLHICLSDHPILYSNYITDLYIGPNICVLPSDSGVVMSQKYKKYLVNSNWTFDIYKNFISESKLDIWPVGIDTELFTDCRSYEKTNDCLFYIKNRSHEEINFVENILINKNISYEKYVYGSYDESNFIKSLFRSKFAFVLDASESQGIAIQEIMSTNIPLFVWDSISWGNYYATTVPYWDDCCGIKVSNSKELEYNLNIFLEKIDSFNPRNFITNNLSLEKSANNLIQILKKN